MDIVHMENTCIICGGNYLDDPVGHMKQHSREDIEAATQVPLYLLACIIYGICWFFQWLPPARRFLNEMRQPPAEKHGPPSFRQSTYGHSRPGNIDLDT